MDNPRLGSHGNRAARRPRKAADRDLLRLSIWLRPDWAFFYIRLDPGPSA